MDDSLGSTLELLVFYLSHIENNEFASLGSVVLINKDKKAFRIHHIQQRTNNPLLTLVDEAGSEKIYSAQTLKPPYWSEAVLPLDVFNSLKHFHESFIQEIQAKTNLHKIKQANNFQRTVEAAIQKHKNILETNSLVYQGYSLLEKAYGSHCYKCKQPVNNKSNYMCNACNHLICNKCGNCKCLFVDLHN